MIDDVKVDELIDYSRLESLKALIKAGEYEIDYQQVAQDLLFEYSVTS